MLNDVSDHFGLAILVPGILKNININSDTRPRSSKLLVHTNTLPRFKLRIEQLGFEFLREELDLNLKFELRIRCWNVVKCQEYRREGCLRINFGLQRAYYSQLTEDVLI
jgi:hypothetical protein